MVDQSTSTSLEDLPEFLNAKHLVSLGLYPSVNSVNGARNRGVTPPSIKVGRNVFYKKKELMDFFNGNKQEKPQKSYFNAPPITCVKESTNASKDELEITMDQMKNMLDSISEEASLVFAISPGDRSTGCFGLKVSHQRLRVHTTKLEKLMKLFRARSNSVYGKEFYEEIRKGNSPARPEVAPVSDEQSKERFEILRKNELRKAISEGMEEMMKGLKADTQVESTCDSDLLDSVGAARLLKVNVKSIYNLVGDKKIPSMKIGRLLRFSRKSLEEWLENQFNS